MPKAKIKSVFNDFESLKIEKNFNRKLQPWLPSTEKSYGRKNQTARCFCEEEKYYKINYYTKNNVKNLDKIKRLRDEDFEKYKLANYFQLNDAPLLLSNANSRIQCVSSGYEIEPFESLVPFIRVFGGEEEEYQFKISSIYGSFTSSAPSERIGSPLASLELEENISEKDLNNILKGIRYYPEYYDARPITDIITFSLTSKTKIEEVKIPIRIRRKPLPVLQYRESDQLNQMITIVTKTIFRYNCLHSLLLSIKEFFPKMAVIVADDNPSDVYQTIDTNEFPTVKQYKMPAEEGWFAGRALAISQVRTPYFVWVDDDTQFNSETKLGEMMKIAEKTGYDVIGGGLGTKIRRSWQKFDRFNVPYSENGYCYNRIRPKYDIPLTGYEGKCFVVDVTANFYLARTSTAGAIRMDPQFEQKAHREFFIDSIGRLRIAYCNTFVVGHRGAEYSSKCVDNDKTEYNSRRFPSGRSKTDLLNRIDALWFYRNNFKCYKDLDYDFTNHVKHASNNQKLL
ncbi:Oidioi.mRNA.OKI2018_I69.chr2.g4187.t1.cds [Oikopleura dioica]|uniref:Oidioi.mRNA.OKI2018_I69.chr2.g4187.t1.cds n=1 Tax=Oikopleura dioica TaxID=34765 RepID=A0ABN7T007_OIKDI|nr:Oidioi.mRNA.OKI2018_I69.chr2.g4187.t1.cds [Oikopleura dioica]